MAQCAIIPRLWTYRIVLGRIRPLADSKQATVNGTIPRQAGWTRLRPQCQARRPRRGALPPATVGCSKLWRSQLAPRAGAVSFFTAGGSAQPSRRPAGWLLWGLLTLLLCFGFAARHARWRILWHIMQYASPSGRV